MWESSLFAAETAFAGVACAVAAAFAAFAALAGLSAVVGVVALAAGTAFAGVAAALTENTELRSIPCQVVITGFCAVIGRDALVIILRSSGLMILLFLPGSLRAVFPQITPQEKCDCCAQHKRQNCNCHIAAGAFIQK